MDVCKWIVLEPYEVEYFTSCSKFWPVKKETPAQQGIEFCPYCGRPIEISTV
jgi:hypothetical protein